MESNIDVKINRCSLRRIQVLIFVTISSHKPEIMAARVEATDKKNKKKKTKHTTIQKMTDMNINIIGVNLHAMYDMGLWVWQQIFIYFFSYSGLCVATYLLLRSYGTSWTSTAPHLRGKYCTFCSTSFVWELKWIFGNHLGLVEKHIWMFFFLISTARGHFTAQWALLLLILREILLILLTYMKVFWITYRGVLS